jgi:hypothetical protein
MRLIVKYDYLDSDFKNITTIVPIHFSNVKEFLEYFECQAKYAFTRLDTKFMACGEVWDAEDFHECDNDGIKYYAPEVLTIDEWFKDVEIYTSDGMS